MVRPVSLAIILLVALPLALKAEIRASIDRKSVKIGEKIVFNLDYSGVPELSADLPQTGYFYSDDDAEIPLYEVTSSSLEEAHKIITVELIYYKTGRHLVNLPILRSKDGVLAGYVFPEIEVTETNKEGKLEEDEDFIVASGYPVRLILICAASLIMIALIIFLIRAVLRRRRQGRHPNEKPIVLLRKRLRMISADESQEIFAEKISSAFREYIGAEAGFNAVEMTTTEIRDMLGACDKIFGVKENMDNLLRVINMWDMIKFAEAEFSRELLADNLKNFTDMAEQYSKEKERA